MNFRAAIVLILIFLSADSRASQFACAALFVREFSAQELDQNITSLARMRIQLDLSKLTGNRSAYLQTVQRDYDRLVIELHDYLRIVDSSKEKELPDLIRAAVVRIQEERRTQSREDERQRKEQGAAIDHFGRQIFFNEIAPGDFIMGDQFKRVPVQITKTFSLAVTQTTQIVWRKVADAAQKKYPGEFDELRLDPSTFKGDLRPVETISFNDVQLWLSAANKLVSANDPIMQEVMPGTDKSSVLRLPTEAEWEFVARARGQATGDRFFEGGDSELTEHAWYSANSEGETHPVGEKTPLVIEGKEFYDFYGNVWEFVSDEFAEDVKGGKDPLAGPIRLSSARILRGGGFENLATDLRAGARAVYLPDDRYSRDGFRLVRSRAPRN